MRLALASLVALALSVGPARAEVITMTTADHPLGNTSDFNIQITLVLVPGVVEQSIGLGGAISGGGTFDLVLDNNNSGTIKTIENAFALADGQVNFSGLIASGIAKWEVLSFRLSFEETVNNRDITFDASTPAGMNFTPSGLEINAGLLTLQITQGIITTNLVLDFADDSSLVGFEDLGTATIAGFADKDGSGTNPAGPEFDLPDLNYSTTFEISGLSPPQGLAVNAQIFVGSVIPEFGSFGLMSLAVAGMGGVVAYRRRRTA